MKRRLTSRVLSRQDICLLCAFRPVLDPNGRASTHHNRLRQYSHASAARSPASATAAARRQDDYDDSDSPMLRQNQKLANSFPFQRQKPTSSPYGEVESVNGRSQNVLPGAKNNTQTRSQPARGSDFRNNFDTLRRRDDMNRARQFQENRNTRRGFDQRQLDSSRSQRADREPKRFEQRNDFQQRSSTDQMSERPSSFIRRIVLNRDTLDQVESEKSQLSPATTRYDRDQRLHGGPQGSGDRASQRQRDGSQSISFRSLNQANTVAYEPTDRNWRLDQIKRGSRIVRARESHVPRQGSAEKAATTDKIEAPAGMSFGAAYDDEGHDHRRNARENKKKSRGSRFEDENGSAGIDATATSKASQMQAKRGVSDMRSIQFDYDMAEAEEALYGDRSRRNKNKKSQKQQVVELSKPSLKLVEFMSVGRLASVLGVQLDSFIQKLEEEGFEGARYDHVLDAQTSSMLAELYGFESVVAPESSVTDLVARPPPADASLLPPRPPIVTIMGHVDHGKTTILDYLRKSSVVATEHGGITQHIGAFSVTMPGTSRQITFLDTPGHAAFLEMRRRGANVTDIVILVVAADDSVKPQTIEAIKHAKEADVQIIVAINKVDKEDANVERVKQDLSRHDVIVEDYGGDFQAIPVSGKTGQGMAELEEAIIALADVYDFRAEQDGAAEGTVIESKVTAAGRVATVLVRRGVLRLGDFIVAGTTWARVRTLRDDTGALVTKALPGTPVQVDGWRGEDPTAGLEVLQAEDEQQAKDVVDLRIDQRESMRTTMDIAVINEAKTQEAEARAKVLAWEAQQEWAGKSHGRRPKDNAGWIEPEASSGPRKVHFVVKADVAGSVEAVVAAVTAVGNQEITANVIHSGTGQVTESDIRMLATTGEIGYAVSFNQAVDGTMYRLAEDAGLQILNHNIIYKVTDTVKEKLAEQLPPVVTQRVLGEAEIGQIFEVTVKKSKVKIAGCKVTNGTISRANKVRVLRSGSVIYTGTLDSLKNVKKDVTEIRKGTECGMGFENWDDFQEGDQIQCFEEHEEKRTLY